MNSTYEILTEGLNDEQKSAVLMPCDSCTKIVAGAGTGKTKIISKRFVKLVQELTQNGVKTPQNRLLVITFTDKAANEMKGRILAELSQNGLQSENQDLWISTFHSFCSRILKKHSIEIGLSPSFKLGEEADLQRVYNNILKRIKYDETSDIENIKEIAYSLGLDSNILSIAKISLLSSLAPVDDVLDEIFAVIKKIKSLGLSPKEFLDKTLRACENFSQTLENTPFKFDSKDEYLLEWAKNFRAYLDENCNFDTAVFDSIAKEKVIIDKFGSRKASDYGYAQGFPEHLSEILEFEKHLVKITAMIYAVYQNELMRLDLADFDDLINKTIEIFKVNPLLRNYYQNYFKHIIVDEFQDTNGAQLELIELLLNSENADITFVGDRKQSIYGFRHAVMENLEVLHKDVEKAYKKHYEPINLSLNYRSSEEVLNAVNFVTEKELGLFEERLSAGLDLPKIPDNVKVTSLEGFENSYEHKCAEAKYIADEILKLKNRDNASYKEFAVLVKSHSQADLIEKYLKKKEIPCIKKVNTSYFSEPIVKNAAALLRLLKNSTDEIALVRVLRINHNSKEIYELRKALDLALLEEIEFDELKKMTFAQKIIEMKNPSDELSHMPIYKFSRRIFEAVEKARKNAQTLLQAYFILVREVTPYSYVKDFERFKVQRDLMVFEKIIADFMQTADYVSPSKFLEYFNKIKEDKSFELPSVYSDNADAVWILTIHASKGLEFPYVFVTSVTSASKTTDKSFLNFDMQYGDKPGFGLLIQKYKDKISPKAVIYRELWKKPREAAEALRLFYVAVSRAKKYLNVLNFEPYGNNGSIKPASYIQNLSDYLGD